VFDLGAAQLGGYDLYDFVRGDVIAEAGQRQAESQMDAILNAYRGDASARISR
jgi:hypothetical protein